MSLVNKKNKRIFISDIHLGDERSIQTSEAYPFRYGWFYSPRTTKLAEFLEAIRESGDVSELIILGDLFDQWVCPTEIAPPSFEMVLEAKQNVRIIEELRKFNKDNVLLSYVPGNHDMLVEKDFLKEFFPNMNVIETSQGVGVYSTEDNLLAAEHGSQYNLFCSVDYWDNRGGYLPVGFFISRVAAQLEATAGKSPNIPAIVLEFLHDLKKDQDPTLMKEVFRAIAAACGLDDSSPINMRSHSEKGEGIDNNPCTITVMEVAERYAKLFRSWGEKYSSISTLDALLSEIVGLNLAAQKVYFDTQKARIVVFGHTHKAMLTGDYDTDHVKEEHAMEIPQKCIYANSGTWINSHDICIFVETEKDPIKGRYYVRLGEYKDTGELKITKERHLSLERLKD